MLKNRIYPRLLLVIGPMIWAYGAWFMETTRRLDELFVLFVIWFVVFDVIMRTGMLEDSRRLFLTLMATAALLAGTAVIGMLMGWILGSDQIIVFYLGVLVYGIGGFLSTRMIKRFVFPPPRKQSIAA